jgi:hypothetical protein
MFIDGIGITMGVGLLMFYLWLERNFRYHNENSREDNQPLQ